MHRRLNWFDYLNLTFMALVVLVTIFPFWYTAVGSLNKGFDYLRGGVILWPRQFTLENYQAVFADKATYRAYGVTILRTVVGTIISVLFTSLVAYGMSRRNLKGKKYYAIVFLITMYFSGGMIPTYILYYKLHLIDTFWVYVIPGIFGVWNMIIIQSYMRGIPEAIFESARIDGAGEYRIWLQLILPISKPVLAAIVLFTAVYHWNSFFDSLVYINSPKLQTIQLYLWKMLTQATRASKLVDQSIQKIPGQERQIIPETIRLATIIVTVLPMLIVYPFLQKYFIKGVLIGSLKG